MQLLNKQLAYPCRVCYNHNRLADVAEWQTHQTQNLAVVTSCGFKSHHPHGFRQSPVRGCLFDYLTGCILKHKLVHKMNIMYNLT